MATRRGLRPRRVLINQARSDVMVVDVMRVGVRRLPHTRSGQLHLGGVGGADGHGHHRARLQLRQAERRHLHAELGDKRRAARRVRLDRKSVV